MKNELMLLNYNPKSDDNNNNKKFKHIILKKENLTH